MQFEAQWHFTVIRVKNNWASVANEGGVNLEEAYTGLADFEYDVDEIWGQPFQDHPRTTYEKFPLWQCT